MAVFDAENSPSLPAASPSWLPTGMTPSPSMASWPPSLPRKPSPSSSATSGRLSSPMERARVVNVSSQTIILNACDQPCSTPSSSSMARTSKRSKNKDMSFTGFAKLLKAIGATGEAVELVKMACGVEGMNFSEKGSHDVVESYGFVTAGAAKPESFKEAINMVQGVKDFIDVYTSNISQHQNFDREMDGIAEMVAF